MNEPTQVPPQNPIDPPFRWHERLLNWKGWEQMVEYRRQLIGAAVCIISLVWLLGWWFARSESSSVANTVRADLIVHRLSNPESSNSSQEVSVQQDLTRLEELCPIGTCLANRFSGIIAEEQVLQNISPLSDERFTIASENLEQAHLPLDKTIVLSTKLIEEGMVEEALRTIDSAIADSREEFSEIHAYALLQKITLLRKLKKPNDDTVKELQQFLLSHPDIQSSFDTVFSGKFQDILTFLMTTDKEPVHG